MYRPVGQETVQRAIEGARPHADGSGTYLLDPTHERVAVVLSVEQVPARSALSATARGTFVWAPSNYEIESR